ncbi:thioredoxin domain-containing protein 15 [Anopheles moucheti]|uniref:thioredoxin domain-containing protein 15 n=1 Tax=Anopheles moucheti TaxID=186751 RepID=UPI0022F0AA4C|nr:thioredoxin domain-containing protein 15 [Anopheles moucheti]
MVLLNYRIVFISAFLLVSNVGAFRFKSLDFYMQLWNGEFFASSPFGGGSSVEKRDEKAENTKPDITFQGQSLQSTQYDYLTYRDKVMCSLAQTSEPEDGTNPDGSRKSPLRVKCSPVEGNGTLYIITSLKDMVKGLPHYGNSTKRNEVGSCFLMLFYTKTCIHSAMVAPHFNALARHFPDLVVTAIDAYNFHFLNGEFGIVGLPTIMLFHQGRPLVKYNGTEITLTSLAKFVTRHTGIEPRLVNQKSSTTVLHYISDDFKGPLSNKVEFRTDYWLYVAWAFIIVCTCYYFSKSTLYAQIIEMIKRNWRESAAQHS